MRRYSFLDRLVAETDHALRTVFAKPVEMRDNPAKTTAEKPLSDNEKRHSAGLMRVDHTGEICAQALYRGQALCAKTPETAQALLQAAEEENDHLAWCQERLDELQSHPSYLNAFWYSASFKIGVLAAIIGDRWSLGFVAETEHQVMAHLDSHLENLPQNDEKSRKILKQMHIDEGEHATNAIAKGAATLPRPIRKLMKLKSKVMTSTAYYI